MVCAVCADANAMELRKSVGGQTAPPDKTGFICMMAGDVGTRAITIPMRRARAIRPGRTS